MKQSTLVLIFGMVYALIALFSIEHNQVLSLIYAMFSASAAILHVILDSTESAHDRLYFR